MLGVAGACSGGSSAVVDLEPGDYRFKLSARPTWTSEFLFEVDPDGAFRGHRTYDPGLSSASPYACSGALTATEHRALTDALDDAVVLLRRDCVDGCVDQTIYHVEIADPHDGSMTHAFRYGPCSGGDPPMQRLIDTADGILEAAATTGRCTGCPAAPLLALECFEDPATPGGLCVGGEQIPCDEPAFGSVLDCDGNPHECDPDAGWAALYTWELDEATVWRWTDAGMPRFQLAATLWASNPRDDAVTLPDLAATLALYAAAGTPESVDDLTLLTLDEPTMTDLIALPARSSNSYTATIAGAAPAEILTADWIFLEIEERSDDPGGIRSATIVDGPPPAP